MRPESPESSEKEPSWSSITDTGSMQPIPEAVAWAERADAWAQRPPEGEQGGRLQRSRWSEVASTGRPAFPADGVGWRTETAEWRATEQTARWRQTTEWRSSSGTHGWRSTTEAWQTGAGAEDFLPPTDPETRQQLAISGTAWPTPQGDEQSATPYDPAATPPENGQGNGSWQRFTDTAPPWQPSTEARPAWQQFAAPPAPWEQPATGEQESTTVRREPSGAAWQQLVEPPSQSPSGGATINGTTGTYGGGLDAGRHLVREDDRARWRRDVAGSDDGARPAGRRRAPEPGSRTSAGTGWSTRSDADNWAGHTDTGSIQMFDESAVTDAPSWGTRSEAPAWRPSTAAEPRSAAPSWQQSAPPAAGRPETDEPASRHGGGSARPAWQADERAEPPRREGGRRRAEDGTPSWRDGTAAAGRPDDWRDGTAAAGREGDWRGGTAGPARPDDWRGAGARSDWRTGGRAETPAPAWRDDVAPPARRDEAPRDMPSRPRSGPAAIGWQPAGERDDDRGGAGRRRETGRQQDGRGWPEDERDTPGWQRDTPDWEETPGREDGGRRRRAAAPADPWAQSAADTGFIPFTDEPPATDTGSWRSSTGAIGRARPSNPNRRRDGGDPLPGETSSRLGDTGTRPDETSSRIGRRRADARDVAPVDPELWRSAPGARTDGGNWPADEPVADWRRELQREQDPRAAGRQTEPDTWATGRRRERQADEEPAVGDAVTEVRQRIDPGWPGGQPDQPTRGTATYREGNTGDWRRELAAESGNLAEGESRRFGTQSFVPFRPVGSAAVPPPSAPVSAPAEPAPRREELLVRNDDTAVRTGEAPEKWPPRRPTGYQSAATGTQGAATGAYERRPVSGLAAAAGRPNNLLEPDEDEIEEDTGGPLAAVGYTAVWYGVPVVLFVLYMLVLNGSQQAHALDTLANAAPQFGLSLVLSMVVAVGLRRASGSWKAASVGLAAAVMGGGLATVLSSAITGNSLS